MEALFFGATTAGEREAASAAAERLKAKLAEASRIDPPVEMKFTMPDQWSARLFIALCRRYGFRPFRYARQRNTTIRLCHGNLILAAGNPEAGVRSQAAVAARHVRKASVRRARSVWRDVRWRWTLKVLWTAA